jgi:hypothetical protein
MSVKMGNGTITFGDGTTLSSSKIPYANISGNKTKLSQFTNNLGNYGNFLTSSLIDTTQYGMNSVPTLQLYWTGSKMSIRSLNCNCVCNC